MRPLAHDDPERIGDYWLAGRLGRGGQGVVYDAYDAQGRRVALKVLHASGDEALRGRFAREVTAAGQVASFCTARVLDADLDAAQPYIVSEYVAGPSLRAAVRAGRRFAGDDLHRLGTAIATALTAIHEAGVVHRDLKPDNVLLGPDGPRVIDFGIARSQEMTLSGTDALVGTPAYMAPESFTGERAGPAADVYAWGAVMVFAATGEDAFRGDNAGALIHQVLMDKPDCSSLPASLRPLVEAALAKEPAGRPVARDLLLALVRGDGAAGLLSAGSERAAPVRAAGHDDPDLGTLAEIAYSSLSDAERALVPSVFLRLLTVRDDGVEVSRRAPVDEVLGDAAAANVLDAYAYVIAREEDRIALTRPALIRAWPRLREWIHAEREGLPLLHELSGAARHWVEQGRHGGDLLRGSRLRNLQDWSAASRQVTLTPVERAFLEASGKAATRSVRLRRGAVGALVVLLVAALAGAGAAVQAAGNAERERDRAETGRLQALSRQLALRSARLAEADPTSAQLLAAAAWKLSPTAEARYGLRNVLATPAVHTLSNPLMETLAFSPDGRTLATGRYGGGVELLDVATLRPIGALPRGVGEFGLFAVAFSPDGSTLAVSGADVQLWDVRTRTRVGGPLPGMAPITFSPDGKLLATGGGETRIWDVASRRRHGRSLGAAAALDFSPDGRVLVIADAGAPHAYALEVATGRRLAKLKIGTGVGSPSGVAFSPDGKHLAISDDTVTLWEVAQYRRIGELAGGGPVSFGSGGAVLACALEGGGVRLWDVATRRPLGAPLPGALGDTYALEFSPDGGTLAAGGIDGVRLWNPLIHRQIGPPLDTNDRGENVTVHRDGSTLVAVGGGAVHVIEPSATRRVALPDPANSSFDASLSPGGNVLAIAEDKQVAFWDMARHRVAATLVVPDDDQVTRVAFSPDGRMLATMGDDVRLWDARTRRQIGAPMAAGNSIALAFGPDSTLLATSDHGKAQLWRVATQTKVGKETPMVSALAFSPDGRTLALGGTSGTRFVDVASGAPRGGAMAGHTGRMTALAFSPDGTTLASGAEDGDVRIWDVATREQIGPPLSGHDVRPAAAAGAVSSLVFDQSGGSLASAGRDGTIRRWRLAQHTDPFAAVCALAARSMTAGEWKAALPGEPYRRICG